LISSHPAALACATHPKRERVAVCGRCGNGVCHDCLTHTGVGIKCRTCTGEKAPAAAARRRPRWLVPAAVGGAVALGAVAAVLALGGGGSGSGDTASDLPGIDQSVSDVPVERKLVLAGGGGTRIGATVGIPGGADKPVAAVLIVPGYGAIDRDAVMATTTPDGSADRLSQDLNYSRPGSPDNLFRDLHSAALGRRMATLRYDKRGSAESRLDASQALSYDDLVADAKAGLDALAQRRELEGVPLAVIGVDQGGLVAMRLAASDPRVRAVVLVSSFGRPLADVVGDDFIAARGDTGREVSAQLHAVAEALAAGRPVPAPGDISGHLRPLLPATQERYLRAVFGLEPLAEARAVRQPALLVRGERDTSTTAVDHERLRGALTGPTEELEFAGGDHNLGERGRRDADTMARLTSWLVTHIR